MGDPPRVAPAALAPARRALIAQAEAEADRLLAEARRRAEQQVAQARRQVEALVERARAEGKAAAEQQAAAELARARRQARALVLATQREAYEELRQRARRALETLRGSEGYDRLLRRLSLAVQARLGDAPELVVDPPEGGIIARRENRVLDYSLPALLERCLEARAEEVARLWR